MLRYTLFSLALLSITGIAQAQKNKAAAKPAFDKGTKTIGISAGTGRNWGYYGNAVSLPAFSLMYDQGIIANAGPGTVGVGGILGYQTARYDYSGGYRATWTNYIAGVRATWHLTILKDKNNKFDPYAGVLLGVRVYDYKDTWYDYYGSNPYNYSSVYPVTGVFVGARYNFSNHFGAFAEAGYDISFLRGGLHINF